MVGLRYPVPLCLATSPDAPILVQGSSAIHPLPFIVLSRFYRPYLTSAGCLLFVLKGPRLTEHFQELTFQMPVSDDTECCFQWGGWCRVKIFLILIHVSVEELKKLFVCSVHKPYEVFKTNLPMLEKPTGAWFGMKISWLSNSNTNTSLMTPADGPIFKTIDISALGGQVSEERI